MMDSSSRSVLGRPTTAASTTSLGGKVGVKRVLDELVKQVDSHAQELQRLEKGAESKGSEFEDAIRAMEARLSAQIESVRQDMKLRLDQQQKYMDQLHETLRAQQGDTGVLQEQAKDSHRRIVELSNQLHDLNVEIMGEE